MAYHRTNESLITAPPVEPVSLADAKAHLRVDGTSDDAAITALITVARVTLEKWCWSAFIQQTWQYWFDRFWWKMNIPRGPMAVGWNAVGGNNPMRPQEGTAAGGVVWIKYLTPAATNDPASLITLPPALYETSAENEIPFVRQAYLKTWPVTRGYRDDVTMQVVVGYGPDASYVPTPLVQATKLLISHLYFNRGEVPERPTRAIDDLITPYRLREF